MSQQPERPTNVRWGIFALACGTSWLLYFHRYAFALIKPELKAEWGLGSDELGMLDSAFFLSYSLFQFPLGVAGDVLGVRLVLTVLILVWSAGLALHALAPSLNALTGARAVFGLGQSAAYACLSRVSRQWFPYAVRTSLQGWVAVFFGRIGGLSTYIVFGAILMGALHLEWRPLMYAMAGAGAAFGLLFWTVFRNDPRAHPWVNRAEADLIEEPLPSAGLQEPGAKLSARQLLRRTSGRSLTNLLALNLQTILSTAADNLYSNWIPLFLAEVYLFDEAQRGWMSSLPLLGGAIGGTMGGWLNDRLIRATGDLRRGRMLVGLGGKGMAGLLLFSGMLVYDRPYVFCAALFLVKVFSDSGLATTWGTVTDIGGRASASVFAFNNAIAGVGSVAAPLVYGLLAESYGWRPVFLAATGCYLLCGLSWLIIDPRRPILADSEQ